ncbi:MAG: galactose-1-epimerase, partial [Lachnospiraceae bacterium]|nr:galactose-1-epimerase [Lachnospiraceae bacterium]
MHTEKYKFGTLSDGTEVTAIKASNDASMSMTIINYGATVQSLTVPAADGTLTDVVLGYDNPEDYERGTAYLGATIGRVGNRIGGAAFTLNGQTYELAKNDGENHLHGGIKGFDKCMWNIYAEG